MKNKLFFLTKVSLGKKIKTKWFLIANIIFFVLIIGIINIDSIINFFGGDFDSLNEIIVIDKTDSFVLFKDNLEKYSKYSDEYSNYKVMLWDKNRDDALDSVLSDDKILVEIEYDDKNYIKGIITSKSSVGVITKTLISNSINLVRNRIVMDKYNITDEIYNEINENAKLEYVVLSDDNTEDDMIVTSIMQFIMVPLFMLIMFLVQMIGAEVNEEKTTRSMEIIISNVSPKIHFMSKIISSNLFVFIQGVLLLGYLIFGMIIRLIISGGSPFLGFESEIVELSGSIDVTGILNSISYMLPIIIIMIVLTFLAYSLLAGILASMTTNLEDFQQLQTPIMIISLIGFYLSMMVGIFKGSKFIIFMSYIPFISCLLSPTLYVLGQITLIDLLISVFLLVIMIYLLIKYGLRIYKVGILNYSGNGLWKKMFKAIKNKG